MKYRFVPVCCVLGAGLAGARAGDNLASRVLEMTGARTKIVWARASEGKAGENWEVLSEEYDLMGFDTAEGKERVILPGPASFGNPSIMPDGRRVVFTDVPSGKICIVDWDGRNKKVLASGFALCGWIDPKTGLQWIYAGTGEFKPPIFRFRVDDPGVSEVLWDKPCSCTSGSQVSADGTRLGSMFPWPKAGVANLSEGSFKQYGGGCEGCMAPDNSYRFFHMGDAAGHGGVMMYDAGGANKRLVRFNNYPGRGRQDAWNARWSTDVRFLTVSSPNAGASQEVYLGEFDEKFTQVKRWVQISSLPGQDLCSHSWIDPGLGHYAGEAPLTVQVPAELTPGLWQWDYGDGTKQSAEAGKHTYTKEGAYTIVARQGNKVLKGSVNVQDRSAPTVTSARLQDDTHVLVTFSERVQLKDAKASLASGGGVKGIRLGRDGIDLTVELAGKLVKTDELILDGVLDLAPTPNPMQTTRVAITPPSWPSDRGGLVLLWETARAPNICFDPAAKAFRPVDLTARDLARFDRLGAMNFAGGAFAAGGAGAGVLGPCRKSGQFAVQLTVTPAAAEPDSNDTPGRILASDRRGGGPQQANFALHQERDVLVLYLRNRTEDSADSLLGSVQRVELCKLTAGTPNHCVVSYRPGELTCFVNGEAAKRTDEVKGALSWAETDSKSGVHFGAAWQAEALSLPWRGKLEGVAIYSRAIDAAEAKKDYVEYTSKLQARKPIPQVRIQVKLAAKSDIPNAADIAPYHSALGVYEYEVTKVLAGQYAEKKIRIARWVLVHKKKTAAAAEMPGSESTFLLERFTDHPELEDECVRNTLPDDFDLAVYVEAEAAMAPAEPEPAAGAAKGQLGLAKSYLAAGMQDKARQILLEIVKKYPKSEQADQATELLKELKGKD